jgi:sugar/nucleoside kinase (ribokinase family)
VGWIVDAGTDFPSSLRSLISSWDTGALIRERNALTTRGWNGYGENEHRAFKYLTEKKRLTGDDLTPELLRSRSFHLICSPLRCIQMVERIVERRREAFGSDFERPLMVWEPVPDLCTPEELENTLKALRYVDVISPNHEELGSLFSYKHASGVEKDVVDKHATQLLSHGIGHTGKGAVVVRCGAAGCYVLTPSTSRWLPAYHADSSRVVDPTGGGNGFLGGLAAALVRTGFDVVEAARWGSVSASFCIEQVGVPQITHAETDKEQWNGESVLGRLQQLKERTV